MGVQADVSAEREAFVSTLRAVGPDAPTACGSWTTTELAVHVALGDTLAGVPAASARALVARGIRVDRLAPLNQRALDRQLRAQGFEWAVARLDRRAPRSHVAGPIGAVSLLEVWAHHDDVLSVHEATGRHADVDLGPVVRTLSRYHRRLLDPAAADVDPEMDDAVLVRWLSGRAPLPRGAGSAPGGAIDRAGRPAVLSI